MAKLGDHVFSAGKGSLGNVVMYTMYGRNYMRLKPAKYNDRKSEAQLAQRARMQLVNDFMKPFKELIRRTYAAEAIGRAPYHEAKSHLMKHAVQGNYPDLYINKHAALLSKGPLPLPADALFQKQDGALLIRWNEELPYERMHSRDTLLIIASDPTAGCCDYRFTDVMRKEGQYKWKPDISVADDVQPDVWIAFLSFDDSLMSNSMYITP